MLQFSPFLVKAGPVQIPCGWPDEMKYEKFLLCLSLFLLLTMPSVSTSAELSRRKIPKKLIHWLIRDIEKTNRMSSEEMEDLNKNLKCELHDLNGDGAPEFIPHIQSHFWCGAGTNCHYWVVQKDRRPYKVLLEDMCIKVGGRVSNGYRDLVSEESMGSRRDVTYKGDTEVAGYRQEIAVRVYKYDGKKYRLRKSYDKLIPFEQ